MPLPENTKRQSWRLEDIDFDAVDVASVRNDEFLFFALASASFVEILSGTYSANMIEHFRDNSEVTGWLQEYWQREEVQHGYAFKTYVQKVWPEFDWESAHAVFREQYDVLCTVEKLEPQRALELVGRCVVETGTSTFYRAMQDYVQEPVLKQLMSNIKTDEATHYTHFRRYFNTYNVSERHGAGAVIAAMVRRLRDIRGDDAYLAYKHVHLGRYPQRPFRKADWQAYNRTVRRLSRRYYPHSMAVKMLLKPIPLVKPLKRMLQWPLLGLALLVSYV